MNGFEFEEDFEEDRRQEKPKREGSSSLAAALWNCLTVFILLGVVAVVVVFAMIYVNPTASYNPFPPPTVPVFLGFPTDTPTPMGMLPPTWTPAPTLEPTLTFTPRPTATLPLTPTPFSMVPTTAAPPTPTITPPPGGYPFILRQGRPDYVKNIAHPDLECNWMGVAGQVLDMSGGPKTQVIVVLGGEIGNRPVDPTGVLYSLTGVALQYGQAGYEFVLSDKPFASKGRLWVQLVNQSTEPLSEKIYFDTYEDCSRNLILINFKQVRP